MKVRHQVLAVAALAITAGNSAHAATLLSDNFESSTAGYPSTPSNWSILNGVGSVDVVEAPGNVWGIESCYSGTKCVDLDGSTPGSTGLLYSSGANTFDIAAGQKVTLSFWGSGNQRAGDAAQASSPDVITFGLLRSDLSAIVATTTSTILAGSGWKLYSFSFDATESVSGAHLFFQAGQPGIPYQTNVADFVGPLIDNVSVTAVPLPAAAWLLLSGLGGVAAFARRRRTAAAAA